MPNRFCAICGKILNETSPHFGMCFECYLKEYPLFELSDKTTFKICLDCGSYSKKDVWIKPESNEIFSIINEAITKFILKSYLKKKKIDFFISFDKDSSIYSSKDLLTSINLEIRGILKNNTKISHQETIKVNLNYELCKNCLNLRGGTYYLSIIQLRVKNQTQFKLLKKIIDKINNYVEKIYETDNRQYISKIVDQKNGVDLFLSTNELMNHIVNYLKKNYNILLKRSKKLVGRNSQKGRNIYRLKSLIKFLPLNKNDIILIDNCEYLVENLSKSKVILRSEEGKKLIKDYSYFFNEKISKKDEMD